MMINYSKIIFLNLIAAIVLEVMWYVLATKTGLVSGFENILFLFVLIGFILSFFIKENLLVHYLKLALTNSLFFGFLFALIFISDIFIHDSQSAFNLTGLIYFSLFFGVVYFFGSLAGIIPKAIFEILRK